MAKDKMTDEAFYGKVQWEGGIFEAMFGYGLTADDLADQSTDLAKAVRKLEDMRPRLEEVLEEIDSAFEDLDVV